MEVASTIQPILYRLLSCYCC